MNVSGDFRRAGRVRSVCPVERELPFLTAPEEGEKSRWI
jgi:hypothetical protein